MTALSDRKQAIELIEEAVAAGARTRNACKELNITLRTFQRWKSDSSPKEDQRPVVRRKAPMNKLTADERKEVIQTVNQPAFQSLPPSQIVPILADRGIYVASESTFYRILREHKLQHHRGKSRKPSHHPITTHCATGPNEVWMWDITWLPAGVKGMFFYLYMILDLYSRKIVGWEIWQEESAANASQLVHRTMINETCFVRTKPLVLHSDNGSPMKASTMLETLYKLGITPSRSRPRVSNDNPYAESLFKTVKYRPGFPSKGFSNVDNAREWVKHFVVWYNSEHRHSGINFLTPNQRHSGKSAEIFQNRISVYEKAKEKNPERWSNDIRNWSIPDETWLNPEQTANREKLAIYAKN
jgi:putative transposase